MFTAGIPAMWVPWAYADLVFLVLFVTAWRRLGGNRSRHRSNHDQVGKKSIDMIVVPEAG